MAVGSATFLVADFGSCLTVAASAFHLMVDHYGLRRLIHIMTLHESVSDTGRNAAWW